MVSMKTKSALIRDIDELVAAVGDRFDIEPNPGEGADAEREFISARCPRRLVPTITSLPALSIHLLAAVADAPTSIVGLAARSHQLKGTVSKHVQRLVEAGLVARTPIPGNRKEIELTLTDDGRLDADAHREMHDEMARGTAEFLAQYTVAELQAVAKVLGGLLTAERVGVRLRSGSG